MAKALSLNCGGTASYVATNVAEIQNTTGALYAAYVFGTDYLGSSLFDYSGNGRDIVNGGAAIAEDHAVVGNDAIMTMPFSGEDVATANDAITIIAVHATPAANFAFLASNYVNATTPAIVLAAPDTADARVYSVSSSSAVNTSITAAADRDTEFLLSAGVWTPSTQQAHYIKGGVATHGTAAAWTSSAPFGGAGDLTISTLVGGFKGVSNVAALLVYNEALTNAQIEAEHAMLAATLTVGMTPIA